MIFYNRRETPMSAFNYYTRARPVLSFYQGHQKGKILISTQRAIPKNKTKRDFWENSSSLKEITPRSIYCLQPKNNMGSISYSQTFKQPMCKKCWPGLSFGPFVISSIVLSPSVSQTLALKVVFKWYQVFHFIWIFEIQSSRISWL